MKQTTDYVFEKLQAHIKAAQLRSQFAKMLKG
jgi:hypothetical protein